MRFVTFILFLAAWQISSAQVETDINETAVDVTLEPDVDRVGPNLRNARPTRAITYSFRTNLENFTVESNPKRDSIEPGRGTFKGNQRSTLKFKVPFYNGDFTKIIFGGKYINETLTFNQTGPPTNYWANINDRNLKSISGALYLSHYLTKMRFLTLRTELSLNGDYRELSFEKVYRLTVSGVYGKKRSENSVYGIGLYYSNRLGRQSIYPVILVQKSFARKWTIQALIPANFSLEYKASDNAFFSTGYELQGSSYTLLFNNPEVNAFQFAEFRSSNVIFPLRYEQRIYDFIWVEMTGGYNYNIIHRLDTKTDEMDNTSYIRSNIEGFFFSEATLILSIPRKFDNR